MSESTAAAGQPSGSAPAPAAGSGTPTPTPGSPGTTPPPAAAGGDPGSGSQSPFQHELLRTMRTPAEVERYVAQLETTVKEQSRAMAAAPATTPAPATTTPEPPKLPGSDDFWKDPVKATQDVVTSVLTQQITPLVQELRAARQEIVQPNIRQRMVEDKTNFPHYADPNVQANIDAYLKQLGILGQETEAQLRQAYFTVTGWMFSRGLLTATAPAPATTTTPTTEAPAVTTPAANGQPWGFPPQHAASSAPLPVQPAAGGGAPLRELTEQERQIANFNWPGMAYDEQRKRYLAWIEVPADGVVGSQIGREQPGGAK